MNISTFQTTSLHSHFPSAAEDSMEKPHLGLHKLLSSALSETLAPTTPLPILFSFCDAVHGTKGLALAMQVPCSLRVAA